MGKVILDMSMSLDGFISGPNEHIGRLHEWYFKSEAGSSNAMVIDEMLTTIGAIVMGRRTYDLGDKMNGFVDNPFNVPHFVLTHNVPEKAAKGATVFNFISDGIESALAQAKAVAGDKSVCVTGGANVAQQYIQAGLIDEIHISLVPVLLCNGIRLFDHISTEHIDLDSTRVIESPIVTHLRFRVVKT
jgi:dihydrofolate reductase